MRQQRHLRLDAEAAHGFCRQNGDLRQLLRAGIVVDVGVGNKGVAAGQQQRVHRPRRMYPFTVAEDLLHHAKVFMILANGAADQRIRLAAMNHDRADHRGVADHRTLGLLLGNAPALHDVVVLVPVLFKTRIRFVVNDLKINARLNLQPQLLNTHLDYARAANQDRFGKPEAHQLLGGVQHTRLFPFCQHHAFGIGTGLGEDRLHKQVRFVDKLGQLIDVGVKIFNRPRRHA